MEGSNKSHHGDANYSGGFALSFHPICKRKYGTHLERGGNQGMQ